MAATMTSSPEYYAGLLDMQLGVTFRANKHVRALLTSTDARVVDQITAKFAPTKITTVRRPGKKESCVVLFVHEDARPLLEFAAEHCLCRKHIAQAGLKFLDGALDVAGVQAAMAAAIEAPATAPIAWIAGVFDMRGSVSFPPEGKRAIKLAFPKSERALLAAILVQLPHGRVKKSSPCRLVFESKESIRGFLAVLGGHVRSKRGDLDQLETALASGASAGVRVAADGDTGDKCDTDGPPPLESSDSTE